MELIDCSENQLIELDISNNLKLEAIEIFKNQISQLDVSQHTLLMHLDVWDNQFTRIDVSNNTELEYLDCARNQLKELDIRVNKLITVLWCEENQLINLSIKNGYNHKIVQFNAKNNPNLTCIEVDNEIEANNYDHWVKDNTASYSEECHTGIKGNLDQTCNVYASPNPFLPPQQPSITSLIIHLRSPYAYTTTWVILLMKLNKSNHKEVNI